MSTVNRRIYFSRESNKWFAEGTNTEPVTPTANDFVVIDECDPGWNKNLPRELETISIDPTICRLQKKNSGSNYLHLKGMN